MAKSASQRRFAKLVDELGDLCSTHPERFHIAFARSSCAIVRATSPMKPSAVGVSVSCGRRCSYWPIACCINVLTLFAPLKSGE